MASKLPNPLNLPEILGITFRFLDNGSLAACARVNSVWAYEATLFLWQQPPISALAALVPSGRAQVYANKITILESNGTSDLESHQAHVHLNFPRLAKVSLPIVDILTNKRLLQYLQPSMRAFELMRSMAPTQNNSDSDDGVIEAFFVQLSRCCPSLQELIITSVRLTANGLSRCLKAIPSLRAIELWCNVATAEDVIHHLAARPNLERLVIPFTISGDLAARVENKTRAPFANLRYLRICVQEDTMYRFSKHMRNLESLFISLTEPSANLLSALSKIPSLRRLDVYFLAAGSVIAGTDLVSLAKGCRGLTHIDLWGPDYLQMTVGGLNLGPGGSVDGSSVKDAEIYHLTSLLPDLQQLILNCECALSVKSLYHLGRNCPHLTACLLSSCIVDVETLLDGSNLTEATGPSTPRASEQESNSLVLNETAKIGKPRPLFPNLECFKVNQLSSRGPLRPFAVTELLCYLDNEAPRLECFHVQSENGFGPEFAKEFHRHKQRK